MRRNNLLQERWRCLELVSCHWLFDGSGEGGEEEEKGRESQRQRQKQPQRQEKELLVMVMLNIQVWQTWWQQDLGGRSTGKQGQTAPNRESPLSLSHLQFISCGILNFICPTIAPSLFWILFQTSSILSLCVSHWPLYSDVAHSCCCFSPSSRFSLLFLTSSHTLSTLYLFHPPPVSWRFHDSV